MAVAAAPVIIPAPNPPIPCKEAPPTTPDNNSGSLFVNTNRIIDARSKTIRLLRSGTSSLIRKNIDL
jgi:hypothetical protein